MISSASLVIILIVAYRLLVSSFEKQVISQFSDYLQSFPGTIAKFDKAKLSFLRSFPRVHLEINGLVFSVQQKEVLKINELTVLLNLRKIIGDSIDVEQVVISDASLNLITDELGNRTKIFSSRDTTKAKQGISVSMTSQEVLVHNFRFSSENRAKKNLTRFNVTEGLLVVGSTKPVTRITGKIRGVLDSLISGGAVILSNLPVSSDNLAFAIDDSTGTQTLEQGFFMVESLKLVPSFSLINKDDGQYVDWSVGCENDLNAFLSIINLKEKKELKQVNPDAKATLLFLQKGMIDALQNPYTELDFSISGAKIESPKMPYPVTDLSVSGNYNNGEKHTARTATIRIDTLHAQVGDSFIQGKAMVSNLKNPQIRAKLNAGIDLQNLIKPTGQFSASGIITANFDVKSKLNDIENDGITGKELASGEVRMQNLDIRLQDSMFRIKIGAGTLSLKDKVLLINRFNGTVNDQSFYFEGQLSDIENLIIKQKIEGSVNAGFKLLDLGWLEPGHQADTSAEGLLRFLNSHLSLAINTSIDKLLSQFGEIDNLAVQGKWEQSKFTVQDINLNYRAMEVQGAGLLSFRNNRLDSVRARANIIGKKLDMEELEDVAEVLGSASEKVVKSSLPAFDLNAHISLDTLQAGETFFFNILGNVSNTANSDLNFDMAARKLQYAGITANSITFSGVSSGAITEIKSCNFSYAGGELSLKGVLHLNDDQTITGNVISEANMMDMKQLLSSFGNFGQSFLTGENVSGDVSWTADLYFRLDTNFITIDDDNFWKFNFKVADSRLTDVVPIEKALSFIRQKSKQDILVSSLDFSTFYVRNKLYFQDVAIKNSISDMNIFGTYSPKDTIADLDLQLSLSDLLFKSLKKRMIETEEGTMDLGKDNNLNLKFTGTMEQHHVKPIVRKEFLKQRALMQSQFNEFEIELQKKISSVIFQSAK